MLNREVIKTLDEKDFVTSLIMSDKCCQTLLPYTKLTYFDIDYSRTIVSWVMEYYKKFKNAPKQDITSLYRTHCDEIQDEALKELILNYIQELGKNDIPINNEDYLVDKGKDFIDYKALKIYTEELNACLETRSMDKARKIQEEYKKISTAEINECDLMDLGDKDIIENALSQEEEVLFTLPGAMNDVFGNIHRNDYGLILAPPKRGKSWLLQKIAIEALKQRLNVIFVSMEMTREEVVQRMWKTLWGTESGLIPDGTYETCRFVEDTSEEGKYRCELVDVNVKNKGKSVTTLQKRLRANNGYMGHLRVIAYPAFGASVVDITNRVEELAENGFVADVLIIDYQDITKPIGGGTEVRNQLDLISKHLRGFSMAFHCATMSASQTNRTGLSASQVTGESIAEDFRKLAHCTVMVSMEQTPKMKKQHLMRLRNIAMRNGESSDPCIFPQCLKLGQFMFGEPIPAECLIMDESDDEDDE